MRRRFGSSSQSSGGKAVPSELKPLQMQLGQIFTEFLGGERGPPQPLIAQPTRMQGTQLEAAIPFMMQQGLGGAAMQGTPVNFGSLMGLGAPSRSPLASYEAPKTILGRKEFLGPK